MSLLKKIYWDLNQRYYSLQKTAHELKSLSIDTGLCNLHCKHCYMNSNNNLAKDLTTDEWKTFFNQIRKNFGKKISLRITGGEPLSRSNIIEILNL